MKIWPTVERLARLSAAYWNGDDDGALDEVQEYYHPEFMAWPLDVSRPQNGEQYISWLKSSRSFIREGTVRCEVELVAEHAVGPVRTVAFRFSAHYLNAETGNSDGCSFRVIEAWLLDDDGRFRLLSTMRSPMG